jgi:hypothetical protein
LTRAATLCACIELRICDEAKLSDEMDGVIMDDCTKSGCTLLPSERVLRCGELGADRLLGRFMERGELDREVVLEGARELALEAGREDDDDDDRYTPGATS